LFPAVLNFVKKSLGLVFPQNYEKLLDLNPDQAFNQQRPFSLQQRRDFEFVEITKVTTTDGASEANNLRTEGENDQSIEKVKSALRKYRALLRMDPSCWHVLMHTADCYYLLIQFECQDFKKSQFIEWAMYYYKEAIRSVTSQSRGSLSIAYLRCGLFLEAILPFRKNQLRLTFHDDSNGYLEAVEKIIAEAELCYVSSIILDDSIHAKAAYVSLQHNWRLGR